MKKKSIGMAVALATFFGAATQVSALTVSDFDSLTGKTQGKALQMIFNGTYQKLSQNASQDKLGCVANLFTPVGTNSVSRGVKSIYEEIDKARKTDPSIHVDDIVLGIIEYNCRFSGRTASKAAPANPG